MNWQRKPKRGLLVTFFAFPCTGIYRGVIKKSLVGVYTPHIKLKKG
jgi:hypothetical protein